MCTLILLRRPGHPWPLLLAANRDEMIARPWRPPERHWPDRPEVVAGLDVTAGGTWLGLNDHGVVAGVLNRRGSLGPAADKRSRGELVLEALDHADAAAAARALSQLDPAAYRSFNLAVADNRDAFWLRNLGEAWEARQGVPKVECFPLPPGFSMLTAYDRNDPASGRITTYLPRFEAAPRPDPETGDWAAWQAILAARGGNGAATDDREAAMTVVTGFGFGTVASSLIALPAPAQSLDQPPSRPVWLFAPGRPDQSTFEAVELRPPKSRADGSRVRKP